MELENLMSAFAEKLGIEGVEVKDGTCSLTIDDIPMEFTESPGGEAVIGAAVVGEPPPERLEGLYKTLLGANHLFGGTAGATISLDPDNGRIALCRALPLATLDGDKFYAEVERFVNTAETWAKVVSDYRGAAAEAPDEGAAEERPAFGAGGFMQV